LKDFIEGFFSCFRAFSFISRNGMSKYYVWVLLLSIVIALTCLYWLWGLTNILSDAFFVKISVWFNIPLEIKDGWLIKGSSLVVGYFIKLFSIYIFLKFSKYIYLALFSPLFAFISEIAEEKMIQQKSPFKISKALKDGVRGFMLSVRNLCIELFFTALFFILSLIFPFLAIPFGIGLLLLSFYFFGFAMLDYNHERWGLTIRQSILRVREHKLRAMGIGLFYYLATLFPFVGWVFAGINGAVGALLLEKQRYEAAS
jgi:CysZ protein